MDASQLHEIVIQRDVTHDCVAEVREGSVGSPVMRGRRWVGCRRKGINLVDRMDSRVANGYYSGLEAASNFV